MNKSDLIAALNELSGKLGRELSTEGTNEVLQARFNEAQAELEMLQEPTIDDEVSLQQTVLADKPSATPLPGPDADGPAPKAAQARIQLKRTLDIWHYKKGGNKRRPDEVKRVREIVPTGRIITVDAEEAALQVAEKNADEA
jgi:hypothetical protein